MRKKIFAAIILALRFLKAVFISGFQTVIVIIEARGPGGVQPHVATMRVGFAPMSETGAALLGAMVCLTPGTTTVEIDMERRELLLHVLDARDIDGLVRGIREDFERYIVVLFGTEARS